MIDQLAVELLTPATHADPTLAPPAEETSVLAVSHVPNRGIVVDFANEIVYLDRDHFPYN